MMSKPAKTAKHAARKKVAKASALATCPVGGSGWCSYPFSVQQLQKRIKKVADEAKAPTALTAAGKSSH